MRTLSLLAFILMTLNACQKPPSEEESSAHARVSVDVTTLGSGIVRDELTLFATTTYLKRNVVTSPIPAFITQVFVKLGDRIRQGQTLYVLETKERRALGDRTAIADSSFSAFGKISVVAPASGIISTLDKQQIGDYVLEGSPLCTIAESSALSFAVNVPYEYNSLAKAGAKCTLVLPDHSRHPGTFTTQLTTMNAVAQTQTVLAKSDEALFLPENLIISVLVNQSASAKHQILPKTAVLTDEMMENFWVMKLINDSTAVKIDITPGTMNSESAEILEPQFGSDDIFLISGNYGLPDTAFVRVNH